MLGFYLLHFSFLGDLCDYRDSKANGLIVSTLLVPHIMMMMRMIHSSSKCLPSTYYEPGVVLGIIQSSDTEFLPLRSLHFMCVYMYTCITYI